MLKFEKGDILSFTYKNYKGEVSNRTVVAEQLYIGSNKWHPENQFMLTGLCLDKREMRCFVLKDMTKMKIIKNEWGNK